METGLRPSCQEIWLIFAVPELPIVAREASEPDPMHLIQLRRPFQRAAVNGCRQLTPVVQSSLLSLSQRFAQLRIDVALGNTAVQGRRYASVKSQGAYRLTNKKTIPKKLGAKKTGGKCPVGSLARA